MSANIGPLIFFAVFAVIVGTFLYRFIKYGGFKAAMFGGHIEKTVGEVKGFSRMGNVKLRVHTLSGGGDDRAIGIELVATTVASYQMLPITLSAAGAQELIRILKKAVGDAT